MRCLREATILVAAACLLVQPAQAHKYTFHTIYSFCSKANCVDGRESAATLLMDQAGNLYGTTGGGGAQGYGTVFKLSPHGGSTWKHETLYSFCSLPSCADGLAPTTSLIIDSSGNLYGTMLVSYGVVFELLPGGKGAEWNYKVLYTFCPGGTQPCLDGSHPVSGLTYAGAASGQSYDGTSPLFSNAAAGGSGSGGVAFKLEPQRGQWKETVLYPFCSAPNCADGSAPYDTPVVDSAGRLFGTTSGGGSAARGTVYSIKGKRESVIYSFCSVTNCIDGRSTQAPVLPEKASHVAGTTPVGGAQDNGVLFRISGADEQVLHSFCSEANCTDGQTPVGNVIEDSPGNLFGVTIGGGKNGVGVLFEYSRGAEHVLHSFCSERNCADGGGPAGGLIMDAAGNIYGTTAQGSVNGGGTVFELEY